MAGPCIALRACWTRNVRLASDRRPWIAPKATRAERNERHPPFPSVPFLPAIKPNRAGNGWADPQTPKPSCSRNKKTAAGFRPAAVLY